MLEPITDQKPATAEEIISRINSKTATIETCQATILIVEEGGDNTVTQGEVLFQKPNKSRLTITTRGTRAGVSRTLEQIMVSDGSILYQYLPALKMATRLHLTPQSSLPAGTELINPFGDIETASLKYIGIERLDGKELHRFEGKTSPRGSPATLHFHSGNNLFYRKAVRDNATKHGVTLSYENIKLNPPTSESDFRLTLPADVVVQDIYGDK